MTTPVTVISRVLSAVSNALLGGGPSTPVESPAMWMLAAAARRQFGQSTGPAIAALDSVTTSQSATVAAAANQPPITKYFAGNPNAITGVVKGSVTATDKDRDPLTFTGPAGGVSATGGTVAVDSKGRFTYTPTVAARQTAARSGATAADKVDTFTVTVDDGQGHLIAQAVTVKVGPLKVAATVTHTNLNTGIATGAITTADPGLFTYKTTTSRKGSLVVASDGTFTYTPTAAARTAAANPRAFASAKTDSYTITLTNSAGKRSTVKLSVAIAPAGHVNQAPTGGNVAFGQPDPTTGAITGTVSATDPDGDALTYEGSALTSKGAVIVNGDGTFTYTPNPVDRVRANVTTGPDTDTFALTVRDSNTGATQLVSATVPVDPVAFALIGNFDPSEQPTTVPSANPLTGEVYQVFVHQLPDGSYENAVQIITSSGDVRSVVALPGYSYTFRPFDPRPAPAFDSVTGTAYLTTQNYDTETGLTSWSVTAITTSGQRTVYDLPGTPAGTLIVDSDRGTVYQLAQTDAASFGSLHDYAYTVIASTGLASRLDVLTGASAIGDPAIDLTTGTLYQTFGTDNGVVVARTTSLGSSSIGLPGFTNGIPLAIDRTTGIVYQTHEVYDAITGSTSTVVTAISPQGAVSTIATIPGSPGGSPSIDEVRGTIYQTTMTPVSGGIPAFSITKILSNGEIVPGPELPGRPNSSDPEGPGYGPITIDPVTGAALKIFRLSGGTGHNLGVVVLKTDGDVSVVSVPDQPRGGIVLNPVTGFGYVSASGADLDTGQPQQGIYEYTYRGPEFGAIRFIPLNDDPYENVVINPVTGAVYQSVYYEDEDGATRYGVVIVRTDGSVTTVRLPGSTPSGGLVIIPAVVDPVTGTAYQVTPAGTFIFDADPESGQTVVI